MRTLPTTAGRLFATLSALLVVAGGVAGCAQQPTTSGQWAAGVAHDRTFKRVLVVGVSPNLKNRCAFERYLAGQIASDATEAFTSCDSIDKDHREPLTRASIEQAVAAQRADAVIATILVANKLNVETGGSRDTRGTAGYKAIDSGWADGYYGAYGVPVIYGEFQSSPEITTIQADVTVSTRVFDARDAGLVYSVETTARQIESRAEGLGSLTTPIAERLRRDGLVR